MYKVIKFFTDLTDNNHPYNVGDVFPRQGATATDERIAELASKNNKQGEPLIKEDAPKKPAPKKAQKKASEE
jgi:hypothetical protein